MSHSGGCYCGAVRYESDGDAIMKGQCHCRECQYIAGGSMLVFMVVSEAGFKYTKGLAKQFKRRDLDHPVTREFCSECGTHLLARPPALEGTVALKVGTLDDPSAFGAPELAIFTCDKQAFHQIPEGIPSFDKMPG